MVFAYILEEPTRLLQMRLREHKDVTPRNLYSLKPILMNLYVKLHPLFSFVKEAPNNGLRCWATGEEFVIINIICLECHVYKVCGSQARQPATKFNSNFNLDT